MLKSPLKRNFLDIYLTTSFRVRKFKNTSAVRVILFRKYSKLNLNFENAKENSENIFRFWDNCIWKCCCELSLIRREYLSSAVNGLKKCPKIFDIIQRDSFNLTCLCRDRLIWWRCCRSDFNNFSARLSCRLSKEPLKQDFLNIYLTTSFRVLKFEKTSAMRVIFFSKYWKLNLIFKNAKKKKKKRENLFRFWDNCIWKCCNKWPLLRR